MGKQDEGLLLPEEEIINLVTEYHFSGEQNRHILANNVAKALPIIEKRERERIRDFLCVGCRAVLDGKEDIWG